MSARLRRHRQLVRRVNILASTFGTQAMPQHQVIRGGGTA
jgi:hypothetical protein